MSSSRLRDMIRAVRACKTAAEERAVIAKECAALRTSFKEDDIGYRHRNVAKLMFIHMLGYPTHFGQMECLKLIAAPSFPEKRIGYLGLMLLMDERQEVLMLVTNSLKNDLNHSNQFITGLALCTLGNVCSAEMARDLCPEVQKLLSNNNSYVRKKAALCAVRIIRKVPEMVEEIMGPATGLLTDKHHGVLISGVSLAIELCQTSSVALEHFRKQTSVLVRALKSLVISGYAPEYDVGGITDPFLQVRLLRLLRLVGRGDAEASDQMSDVLAQVATNTESNKNAGNAILYECVQTIMGIEAVGGLRVLAVNILGRFLANRDNNIRYVALNTLVKVVAVDTQAVQRHRQTIVECVKDSDVSIRRRALELVYALVNESNVTTLTKELLEYLKISDAEFKPDLTAKIAALVQRFYPRKEWYIDTMIKVMDEAGAYVKVEVVRSLIVLITNAPPLHGYCVRSFFRAFQEWKGQESLALVTVWCIGEYGECILNHVNELEGEEPLTVTEADVVDVLESTLKDPRATPQIKAFVLTALLKLAARQFTSSSSAARITSLVDQHKASLILELQQRAAEYGAILDRHSKIKGALAERIPALDEAAYRAKQTEGTDNRPGSPTTAHSPTHNSNKANGGFAAKGAAPTANLMDLLDLSVDDGPAPAAAAAAVPAMGGLMDLLGGPTAVATATAAPGLGALGGGTPVGGGADMLLDLLSLGSSSSSAPAPVATSASSSAAVFPMDSPPPLGTSSSSSTLLGTTTTQPYAASTAKDPLAAFMGGGGGGGAAPVDPFAALGLGLGSGVPSPSVSVTANFPSIVAFESNGLRVTFDFKRDATGNPQATTIHATYANTSPNNYTDFVFQAAVPKFMQLMLEPASGSVLAPSGATCITQNIQVVNSLQGQKSLVMKLRISYKVNGQEVVEQGQVNNFPAGL